MNGPESAWVMARPSGPLSALVDRYVGYRMAGYGPGLHRGMPSRHMTFIASIGPAIDVVAQTDPRQQPDRYRCVLSGLQASPALISHGGHQEGVAIELTPLGARALLGMPARALWNTSLELSDVVGPIGDELWYRLQGTPGWPERFATCDRVLGRVVGEGGVAPELVRAWRAIVASAGTVAVSEVVAEVGWSRQHLTRRFVDEFGLGPKLAARVVRFERARTLLQRTAPSVGLAELASMCGYYDQAHLNRDFADLGGCTPTQWRREEVPSVQDDHLTDPAPSVP